MSGAPVESGGVRGWLVETTLAWDRFWFAPRGPQTLAVVRILCGAMLAYVHLIWLTQLNDFFGPDAWIDGATVRAIHELDYSRSYLTYVTSPWFLTLHQLLAIAAGCLMAVGLWTRVAVPLVWFLTLMVCHRQTGALFGLDQVVMMLAMYLMLCPCGAVYSLDAVRERRSGSDSQVARPTVAVNVATRLIQLHLCIIYLFGGLSKMRGDFWWEGSAMWWSIVNYEYQSLDIAWLGRSPVLIAVLTHVTIFWETFYAALVWPRLTRPIVLAMAVFVHGGIAIALGMPTFGSMMIVANLAFVEPRTTARWVEWAAAKCRRRGF